MAEVQPLTTQEIEKLKTLDSSLGAFANTTDPQELTSLRNRLASAPSITGAQPSPKPTDSSGFTPTGIFINSDGSINFEKSREEGQRILLENQQKAQEVASKTQNDNNFVSSSSETVNAEKETTNAVRNITPPTPGVDAARAASDQYLSLIDQQMKALEERRKQEVQRIEEQFAVAKQGLEQQQKEEKGTFATTLQRIGGFLGPSASGTSAMIKLAANHRSEVTALEAKKASAIQAANNAIEDKQFQLARLRVEEVKEIEDTIHRRKQEFFDNNLKLVQEERQQDKFLRDKFKDELETLATVSISNEELELDPARAKEIDDFYGVPGFTQQYLEVVREEAASEAQESRIETQKKMLDLLQKIPSGMDLTFPDGTTYTGLGSAGDVYTTLQTDDSGQGHLITHNKLTGQTSVTGVGAVGKTKSDGSIDGTPEEVVFDNVVAKMSIALEQAKDEDGTYDPDVYLQLRQELKSKFPALVPQVDKLFLAPTNELFSPEKIDRLREQGVFAPSNFF